jgi:hydrogenase expression/formation protein HypE
VNGVTAMHDATECGVWGGLYELAQAAGLGARVEKEKIIVEEGVPEVCRFFGIDPYASISEGTLIIACKAPQAATVVAVLAKKKIKASVVGELTAPEKGMVLVENGKEKKLEHPIVDPFWRAFYDALKKYRS